MSRVLLFLSALLYTGLLYGQDGGWVKFKPVANFGQCRVQVNNGRMAAIKLQSNATARQFRTVLREKYREEVSTLRAITAS